MAGAHIEREARYETTGLTALERDRLIVALRSKGWTQARTGRYLGMTQPAIHYALERLAGKSRRGSRTDMCEGCWETFRIDPLNRDGLCPDCA
jgi:hypothetical protein